MRGARKQNRETLLRMNALLNDLVGKEVGVNDGTLSEGSDWKEMSAP